METISIAPSSTPSIGPGTVPMGLNPFTLPVVMRQEAAADMGARKRRRRMRRRYR